MYDCYLIIIEKDDGWGWPIYMTYRKYDNAKKEYDKLVIENNLHDFDDLHAMACDTRDHHHIHEIFLKEMFFED
jgi:hypothetical protein